jgi:signal transduction histidine kinase
LSVEKSKGDILFEIIDNGIGMDEKTVSQMFNMFFSAKGKQGTGWGLFITQRIVKTAWRNHTSRIHQR